MNRTRIQLEQDVFLLINEDYNSNVGEEESGTNATPTVTSLATVDKYLNLMKDHLCDYLPFISGWGRWPSLPVGTVKIALHDPAIKAAMSRTTTTGDSSILTAVDEVRWDNVKLDYISPAVLRLLPDGYQNPQRGTPKYWYFEGTQGIGLMDAPSVLHNLDLFGFVKAPNIEDWNETTSWTTDDKARLLAVGAAGWICRDNMADQSLAALIPLLAAEFDSRTGAMWDAIPAGQKAFYPTLPGLMGSIIRAVKKP